MIRIALGMILLMTTGCSFGPWGGPAYTLDPGKIGTGQQAITPRNDGFYSNGYSDDYRTRR